MPCDDAIAAENVRPLKELAEFHISVAVDTWIGRKPVFIALDKSAYDCIVKIPREIEYIKPHTELVCNAARVLRVIKRAARARAINTDILSVEELHGTADAFVPAVNHYLCGKRGVHSSAHCNQRSFHFSDFPFAASHRENGFRNKIVESPPEHIRAALYNLS